MSPGALLAVDYGTRRLGLARSDPDRILASGLPTFERAPGRSFEDHLVALVAETEATGLVLGFPYEDDGLSPLAGDIVALGTWAASSLRFPVAYWDETLTSREAEIRLRSAPRKRRRDKGEIDRIAATILLQEFLDAGCPFATHLRPRGME